MALNDTLLRGLKNSSKVQKLSDGGGLYLHMAPTGGKLWRLAYRFDGKQKNLAMGAYPAISLKDARKLRENAKECPCDLWPSHIYLVHCRIGS